MGNFNAGMIEGKGTYQWVKGGRKYFGSWRNNKMDGFGTLSWQEGDYYRGEFQNDKFHGQGRYQWSNGQVYIGGWNAGK